MANPTYNYRGGDEIKRWKIGFGTYSLNGERFIAFADQRIGTNFLDFHRGLV